MFDDTGQGTMGWKSVGSGPPSAVRHVAADTNLGCGKSSPPIQRANISSVVGK
jgi:hypothetical protein